jgi:threonine/homoserine/homoserine lactone efflux protein
VDYLSLILFTVATCGTPGPNNTMVMASGAGYGVRASMPAVIGINTGFPIMVVAVGLGIGGLLRSTPAIYDVLRVVGAAYLLFLAYRIATAPVSDDAATSTNTLTFLKTALFQFVNPKAWVMIVGALVTYSGISGDYFVRVLEIALVFLVFGTPCTFSWVLLGASLQKVVHKPAQFRAFNIAMAALLALSLIPVLEEIVDGLHT